MQTAASRRVRSCSADSTWRPAAPAAGPDARELLNTLAAHPERSVIEADLLHLFRSWFNRGFLRLQRIDWRTSALVLERLIQYEAVHQIQGWDDLRRRLAGRPSMLRVLSSGPSRRTADLHRGRAHARDPSSRPAAPRSRSRGRPIPHAARCALFYSITNCQEGLRGISFGNFLIKQVAEDLGASFPRLRTFATISPIPGFVRWLKSNELPAGASISPELAALLEPVYRGEPITAPPSSLQQELRRLCSYYLLHAKHGQAPLDSVARFHLANGARLERLNWLGDTSPKGLVNSLGLSVNYVYRLADVERNHEAYAKDYDVVASRELHVLANSCRAASVEAGAGRRRQR